MAPQVGRRELLTTSGLLLGLILIFLLPLLRPGVMPSASGILQAWPTFQTGSDYRSYNDLPSDMAMQHEPWTRYARQRLAKGELPLWNPHQAAGVPFVANMQSAVYSPFTWIVYVMGDRWGPIIRAAAILYLSGILAYLHLRGLGLSVRASRIGMIGWTFSGGLTHWLFWRSSLFGFLLPGSLWLTDRAFKRVDGLGSSALGLAALVALGITAGHPERVMPCAVAAGINLLYRLISAEGNVKSRLRITLVLTFAGFWGAVLGACALLPFFEYSANSLAWVARAGGYEAGLLPKSASVLMLMPDLYGNRALPFAIEWSAKWTNDCEALNPVVGLALLMAAVLICNRTKDERRLYMVLGGLAVLLAYGVWPVWPLVNHVPVLDRMAWGRFSALLAYSVCVLAAMALDDLEQGRVDALSRESVVRLALLLNVGVGLVAWNFLHLERFTRSPGVQNWWIGCAVLAVATSLVTTAMFRGIGSARRWAWIGLGVLVFLETGVRWMGFSPQVPAELYYPRTEAVQTAVQSQGGGRFTAAGLANPFPPNLATVYGLRDIKVYDNLEILHYRVLFDSRLKPRSTGQILDRFSPDALSVLGVGTLLTAGEDAQSIADAEQGAPPLEEIWSRGGVRIWRNPDALPRAFFVPGAVQLKEVSDVFGRDEYGLVARRAVFLTTPVESADAPAQSITGEVEWVTDEPELIELAVHAPQSGYLVLLDAMYPDWRAWVDDGEVWIMRANVAFRAVPVQAGDHVVRFKYEPWSVGIGLIVSGAALLAWLAALAVFWMRRRRMTRSRPVV